MIEIDGVSCLSLYGSSVQKKSQNKLGILEKLFDRGLDEK